MSLKLKLTALKGKDAGTVNTFPLPGAFIGREKDNDLCIDEDGVSKYHAEITFKDGRWLLKDLNSSNGTKVNGIKISDETELKVKDIIHFANFAFRFEVEDSDPVLPKPFSGNSGEPCIKIRSPEESRQKTRIKENEVDSIEYAPDSNKENKREEKHRRHSSQSAGYSSDAARAQARVMRRMGDYAYEQKKKRLGRFILLITIIINLLIFYYWYVYIYSPAHKKKNNVIPKLSETLHLPE